MLASWVEDVVMVVANENRPAIGRAIVLPGAVRYAQRTFSATYVGLIRDEVGAAKRALIKDLAVGDLVRELVGTAAAARAGIAVPQAYLAAVEDGRFETARGPALNDRLRLVFATEFVEGAQLIQLLNQPLPERLLNALLGWAGFPTLFAFDTWVANVDRHAGNLLVKSESEFIAIDHGHCLGGPTTNTDALDPSAAFRNRLAEWLVPSMSPSAKLNFLGALANLPSTLLEVEVARCLRESFVANIDPSLKEDRLTEFLSVRKKNLVELSLAAFGR